MGVIKRISRSAVDPSISENEGLGDIGITVLPEEEESENHDSISLPTQGGVITPADFCRRRSARPRVPAIPSDSVLRRNTAQGARRARRYENTLLLVREAGRDDAEQDEVSIEDLAPVIQTARTFGRFLRESSMMGLWNKFLECSDDALENVNKSRRNCKRNGLLESEPKSADPEQAFSGICRKLRNMLKQRHLPLGIVEALEVNVLEFFLTHPLDSTYECGPLDAYRRGLLHAISQYNNLKSFSIGKKKTEKVVHVQNVQSAFVPPSLRLVSYIEKRLQSEPKL